MRQKLEWSVLLAFPVVLLVAIGGMIESYVSPRSAHAASQFANILCDGFSPVSITSATSTQIVTAGGPNNFVYVCSYNLNASAALTFSMIEGTGTACATNTKAMVGTTTATNGPSLASGSTINYGGGTGAVTKTQVAGDNVCLIPSAGTLSGVVSSTQGPY
jgi:hypothetical protein